jgi:hypothetical protein
VDRAGLPDRGTYFGNAWNTTNNSVTQVGAATFTPTSAITGTLAYNVSTVAVTKSIQRQSLTAIPLGGTYRGAYQSIFSNCNDPRSTERSTTTASDDHADHGGHDDIGRVSNDSFT